ncbi:hypothetical protein JCM8202_003474 [Rhodotorula sphaerocarpa]
MAARRSTGAHHHYEPQQQQQPAYPGTAAYPPSYRQAPHVYSRPSAAAIQPPSTAEFARAPPQAYPPFVSTSTSQAYLAASSVAGPSSFASPPPNMLSYGHGNGLPALGPSPYSAPSSSRYHQFAPPAYHHHSPVGSGGPSGHYALPAPPPFIAPRAPAPLFDRDESALLSSFLTTLDVDPNFLFNPVLPPGMPSPPPVDPVAREARERWEREQAHQLRLMMASAETNRRGTAGGSAGPPKTAHGQRRIPDLVDSEDENDADAPDDAPLKEEADDDPDFEPTGRAGGLAVGGAGRGGTGGRGGVGGKTRQRGSRGSGRAKKGRPAPAKEQARTGAAAGGDDDEDVAMAPLDEGQVAEGSGSADTGSVTASGRPKRNARPPKRLSGSTSGAATKTPRSAGAPPAAATAAGPSSQSNGIGAVPARATLPPLPASPRTEGMLGGPPPEPPSAGGDRPHQHLHHVSLPLPHGVDFGPSGPLSPPGLDELPEPPASSYAEYHGGTGVADTPPVADSPGSSAAATPHGGVGMGGRGAPLTDSQKRSNHILSEQKRRNAIRSGFKDLVDFLVAGEAASGIVLGPPGSAAALQQQQQAQAQAQAEAEEEAEAAAAANGKKRKGKGTGRGRGRRGDAGANASKSVVLTRAADYILWLERGNRALEAEIERIEVATTGV